jgi:hypothetical protein
MNRLTRVTYPFTSNVSVDKSRPFQSNSMFPSLVVTTNVGSYVWLKCIPTPYRSLRNHNSHRQHSRQHQNQRQYERRHHHQQRKKQSNERTTSQSPESSWKSGSWVIKCCLGKKLYPKFNTTVVPSAYR